MIWQKRSYMYYDRLIFHYFIYVFNKPCTLPILITSVDSEWKAQTRLKDFSPVLCSTALCLGCNVPTK